MQDFLTNLTSISWWIGVVVVGILINLFSAYLKKLLDKRLSKASSWWQTRSEAQREKRERQIERLRKDPNEQIKWALNSQQDLLLSILFTLFSVGLGIGAAVTRIKLLVGDKSPHLRFLILFFGLLLVPLALIAIGSLNSFFDKTTLLNEARKQEEPSSDEKTTKERQ